MVGLAIYVVVAVVVDQADAFDLAAFFDHGGRAFDLQVFDQQHAVAIGQRRAVGVFDDAWARVFIRGGRAGRPFDLVWGGFAG